MARHRERITKQQLNTNQQRTGIVFARKQRLDLLQPQEGAALARGSV
jgi:hypothetical protein